MSTPLSRLNAMVHGHVQGVGYRMFVIEEARRLGLAGWVRNRSDGPAKCPGKPPSCVPHGFARNVVARGDPMVSAFVLLNVERNCIERVADELASLKHVSEVYSVSGRYDLIAIVLVQNVDELSVVVTHELLQIAGITHSETMLAFRAYSRYDLERLFSIGATDM
jgi:DNA-binding Lrp family transcriptional regulator